MIEIAKILKPQGIKGEVKVQLFSDNVAGFCDRGFAYLKNGKEISYSVIRENQGYLFLSIDGVDTRNDAEAYRGVFLYLDRSDFDETQDGEYYICDLIGLEITDEAGTVLGKLKEVLQHGAADVYVVKGPKRFMFPALKSVLKSVTADKIIVDSEELSKVAVYDD